jgi:alpha-tubulin suppressor-like RCC1 family protein
MRKFTGLLLMICLLAGFAAIPASAAFSAAPAIAAGGNHSVALASNGTVWAWGDNESGQLGDGTQRQRAIPVQVPGLCEMTAIAAGSSHTAALKSDGTVWAWGRNAHGQLGDGTTTMRISPVQVQDITDVIAIATHDNHTLALRGDGTVWVWGDNGRGQLGYLRYGSSPSAQLTPVLVEIGNVTAIAAGWGHSLALRNDGTVWAWGCLRHGELPTEQHTQSCAIPQKIELDNVTAIAAGGINAAAVRSDGTVWTWQAADPVPAQVQGLSGVKAIAMGVNHILALKNDGTLWAWGDNKFGQLGVADTTGGREDGTAADQDIPVQLPEFSDVTAVAAHDHSLALKSDGVVWAWGSNVKGQLGNGSIGTEFSSAVPGWVQTPFKRGLLKDNNLNLFDTHPWWRSMCGFLQFIFRYLFFGWLWM